MPEPFVETVLKPGEPFEYRSVPGRATSPDRRRVDISCLADVSVSFYRLRGNGSGGIERTWLGRYIVGEGHPFIWPVPPEAQMEDILVVVENLTDYPGTLFVMDYWRTN